MEDPTVGLPFNTQRWGGPILDHAPLNIYGAKPSGQISSNQYSCPSFLRIFLVLGANKAKAEKIWVLKCRFGYFQCLEE